MPTSADGSDRARRIVRRCGVRLWLLVCTFYVATAGGSLTSTDAVVTYELTRQIVERGTVALPGNLLGQQAHRGRDGRYYSPFGIAQSIVNIPFFLAARGVEALGLRVGPPDALAKAAVALGNTVVMASVVLLIYLFAVDVSGSIRASATAALAGAIATPLWPYSKFGFNAPLAALCVTAATMVAWRSAARGASTAAWCGVWIGFATLTRHELALTALPIAGFWTISGLPAAAVGRRLGWLAVGLGPALLVWVGYNWWRFGNPFDSGYLRDPIPAFGSSLAAGLGGLLFSPASSLFVYCPLVFASIAGLVVLWRVDRPTTALLAGTCVTFLLFYAQLGNWMGGRSYGPRYLIAVLPLLCVALVPLLRRPWRVAVPVLILTSAILQLPGVVVDYAKVSVAYANSPRSAEPLRTTWSTSALVLNACTMTTAIPANVNWLLGRTPRPPIASGQAERGRFSQQFSHSLDFWWMYFFHMRIIGAWTVALIGAAFSTALLGLGAALRRALSAQAAPGRAVGPAPAG